MSRESFVFLIGFIIFFTPFFGVPREWKEWIILGAGALLMFLGYKLRRAAFLRSIMQENGEHRSDAFVEHMKSSQASPYMRQVKAEVAQTTDVT
jgi:hypothetical protein